MFKLKPNNGVKVYQNGLWTTDTFFGQPAMADNIGLSNGQVHSVYNGVGIFNEENRSIIDRMRPVQEDFNRRMSDTTQRPTSRRRQRTFSNEQEMLEYMDSL